MKLLYLSLFTICLATQSCSSSSESSTNTSENLMNSPLDSIPTENTPEVVQVVEEIAYMKEVGVEFPIEIQQQGERIDGVRWIDANGENFIQVYQIEVGTFFEEGFKSELHVYHHFKGLNQDAYTEQWHVKDFSSAIFESVDYWPHSLKVFDLDADGRAETEFIYGIVPDGIESFDLKYMLHSNGEKLPIRGSFYYKDIEVKEMSRNIDPALEAKGEKFVNHAIGRWEQWVQEETQSMQ